MLSLKNYFIVESIFDSDSRVSFSIQDYTGAITLLNQLHSLGLRGFRLVIYRSVPPKDAQTFRPSVDFVTLAEI